MSTTVKVLDAKKELATHSVKSGEVLVLNAQSNVNYQLINDQTGFGPQNIITKRQGDDLVIFLEDGNMNEDIIIKGYYADGNVNSLITGLHENGQIYAYVPESGKAAESISVLAEEVMAPQALGGVELAAPFWAFNPWWIAGVAGVAGIIALAASGGSSGGSSNNGDNKLSTDELERLVKAAEAEKANAEKALAELQAKIASNGGVVNPEDAANLVALNAQVEAAKEAANKALAQLGDFDGKAAFESRLAAVTPVNVPAVNDTNSNGKTDEQDLKDALDALSAAEAAQREYEEALNNQGETVTPEDFARLSDLKTKADSLRATAEKLLAEVPNNQADKPSLTERLEKLATQEVPFVTDADSDGKHDAQVEVPQATDVVAAAEAAQALLEAKLKEFLGKNNLITDAEQKELIQLSKLAAETKAKALPLVQGLPSGEGVPPTVTNAKADLTARLEKLNGIDIPAVNDSNADGLPDSPEDLVKYAEELSDKAAKLKAEIEQDPTIEKAKADELALLIEQAASAQDKAKSEVEALPETDPKKEELAERAENATPPEGLVSNDLDNDGKLDTVEFSEADDALAALEKAVEAAKAALAKAEEDGVITPEEQAAIKAANKAVEDVKSTAYQAVKELPDLDPRKSDYVKREADLKAVKVPAVNADETGKPLTLEDLVAKSEEAEKAAQEFLDNLPENPTLADIAKLEALNEEVNNAKLAAKEEIDKLEDPAAQEAFNTRLDEVNPVEVPKATDLSNIEDLVKKAEEAQEAYNQKLAELAKDGLISSDDLAELEPLKTALDTAKDAALDAIDELRAEQQENGDQPAYRQVIDNLEERAGLLGAELPQVNDFDNDGVSDTRERKQVQDLIEKAEKARADYDAAKQAAESNGLITPEEQAKLDELRQAIDSAKEDAATAIEALKEGVNAPQAELDALNARLDKVESVPAEDVPAINDADSDGVADANSVDGQPSELDRVKALLKDAEDIRQKAADRLAEITKDGRPVTPAEQQEIVKLNEQLAQAKAKVQDALANLPATQEAVVDDGNGETLAAQKSSLTDKEAALTALPVPAVTDLNGDGVADSVEDLVQAAKEAAEKAQELKDALPPSEEGGEPAVITADQAKAINDAIELAEAAKKAAEDAINALPEDAPEKAEQAESLKAVEVPTAVEPNSVDNDNIPDEIELEKARELTQTALDLAKQAEEKLAEITADGKVTPQEVEELTKLNEEVTKAKEAAKQAQEELPKGVADEAKISDDAAADAPSLSALEQSVAPVAVPAPTADENGEPLSVEDLVEQAKQAEAEAEKALEEIKAKADSEGITPADIEKLEALNDKVEAAKQAAQKAIDELPNTDPAKDDFNDELKEVNPVETPELVQSPAEEKVEDLLKEARDAEKALNDKLAELAQQEANDNVAKAEQALEEAQKAAEEATQATEEAKQATEEAKQATEEAKQATEEAKQAVEEAKKALEADPTSEEAQQAVKDAEEAQKAAEEAQKAAEEAQKAAEETQQAAEEAQKAAEEAQQAAEEDKALADENKALTDKAVEEGKPLPFISDETAKAAEEQAKALEDAKAKAEEAINALPDPKQQEQFTNQLADIDSETPEVNDFDGDGISDNDELQAAKDQITAAEKAEADYEAEVARLSEGGISPEEKATLDAMRDDVLTKKADAQKAIDELKEGIGPKATDEIVQALNDRLAEVDPQAVPAVTDLDGDNISDEDEIQAAKDAEQAAKDALKAYTDELEKAKEGGVSPAELEKLEELKQAADEAKAAADKAKEELPANVGEEKANEAGIEDAADVPALPPVSDFDGDNTSDDAEIQAAKDAEQAAKDALKAYTDELEKAKEGGVSPAELEALKPLKDAADEAKALADKAKEELPANVGEEKANEAGIEDAAAVPDLPPVSDQDGDNTPDDAEIQAAKDAAKDAADKLKEYTDALAEANKDGLVTPAELEKLDELKQAADEAKALADTAKEELPANVGQEKADAAGIEDAADVPALPEVTDFDADGKSDADEIQAAKDAAKDAADKLKEYTDALAEAEKGGVSQDELKALEPLKQAAEEAKALADTAKEELPASVGEEKANEAGIEDAADVPALPEVTDFDGDNTSDDAEIQAAKDAAKDAADKLKEYTDALAEANKDGLVTPDELKALEPLKQAAEEAKALADTAKEELPANVGQEKADAAGIEDAADVPALPEVTDYDADNTSDDAEIQAAKDAAKDAADKLKEYTDALAEANKDGLVTPDELKALEPLKQAAEEAKALADTAKEELPANVGEEKANAAGIEDAADVPALPEVTDYDADGTSDDAEIQAAKDAEQAAKDALKAYTDELEKAKEGGVSPAELEKLDELKQAAEEAKALADTAKEELPASVGEEKANEAGIEDAAAVPDLPPVTDFDGDNTPDEDEIQAAKDAEQAAKDALKAYTDELEKAKEGGVSPAELEKLDELKQAAEEAKTLADTAKEELPANVGQDKADAAGIEDAADVPALPEVTDYDGDGTSDDDEITDAQNKATEADTALQNYQTALDKANEDGLVTPAELEALKPLKDLADAAKIAADNAKGALPAGVGADKAEAAGIEDAAAVPDLPEVNDYDADGTSDDDEITDAQNKATEADTALQNYQTALDKANKDGLVTPAELERLQPLKDLADAAKIAADNAKGALPAGVGADKATAAGIDDAAEVPELPPVTDYDADGTSDDAEIADAQTKATEADTTLQNYQTALDEVNADNLVTPAELERLQPLKDLADAAKIAADNAKGALPAGVGADKAQAANVPAAADVPDLPEVNDYDADGTSDDAEIENAKTLATNAATALKAYNDKLLEFGEVYSKSEVEALKLLREDAVQAKEAADNARNRLSTDVGEAKATAANISPTGDIQDLPPIKDFDGDGKLDETVKAEVQAAQTNANEKVRLYNERLQEARANGISESEAVELRALKAEAEQAANALRSLYGNVSDQLSEEDYEALNVTVPTIRNIPAVVHAKPVKSDFSVDSAVDSKTITGAEIGLVGKFVDGGADTQPDRLSKVRIVSLPENGKLMLNGAEVTAGQELTPAEANSLTYTTNEPTYSGQDTFTYQFIDTGLEENESDVGTVTLNLIEKLDPVTVTPNAGGSVTITPGADNTKLVITYYDETGSDKGVEGATGTSHTFAPDIVATVGETVQKTITLIKDGAEWKVNGTDPLPAGITQSGNNIEIGHDSIMGGTDITAVGSKGGAQTSTATETVLKDIPTAFRELTLDYYGNIPQADKAFLTAASYDIANSVYRYYDNNLIINDKVTSNKEHTAYVLEYGNTKKYYVMKDDAWYNSNDKFEKLGSVSGTALRHHDTWVLDGNIRDEIISAGETAKLWSVDTSKGGNWQLHSVFKPAETTAQKPTVVANADGSVTITPYKVDNTKETHVKLVLTYTDESRSKYGVEGVNGTTHTFTAHHKTEGAKDVVVTLDGVVEKTVTLLSNNGRWYEAGKNVLPAGFIQNPDGSITIGKNAIMGDTTIKVRGENLYREGLDSDVVMVNKDADTDDRDVQLLRFNDLPQNYRDYIGDGGSRNNGIAYGIKPEEPQFPIARNPLVIYDESIATNKYNTTYGGQNVPIGKSHKAYVIEYGDNRDYFIVDNDQWFIANKQNDVYGGDLTKTNRSPTGANSVTQPIYHDTWFLTETYEDKILNGSQQVNIWSINPDNGGKWELHSSFVPPAGDTLGGGTVESTSVVAAEPALPETLSYSTVLENSNVLDLNQGNNGIL